MHITTFQNSLESELLFYPLETAHVKNVARRGCAAVCSRPRRVSDLYSFENRHCAEPGPAAIGWFGGRKVEEGSGEQFGMDISNRLNSVDEQLQSAEPLVDVRQERVILSYDKGSLFPSKIRYGEGRKAEFQYDEQGLLQKLIAKSGKHYTRLDDGLFHCSDSENSEPRKIEVMSNGTIWHRSNKGRPQVEQINGSRWTVVQFSDGLNFSRLFSEFFSRMDHNADGGLSKLEIERSLEQFRDHAHGTELLEVLQQFFEEIIHSRDDPLMSAAGGMEVSDLERFHSIQLRLGNRYLTLNEHARAVLDDLFKTIDSDCAERLAISSIVRSCTEPTLSLSQKRTLQRVLRFLHEGEDSDDISENSMVSLKEFAVLCIDSYEDWVHRLLPVGSWYLSSIAHREL